MEGEITVRVEDNPSTPERTLRPIVYVSWLLGVGIARPRKCPIAITVILRLIHFGLCTVIVAFSAVDFANFGKEFTSKLFEIMYCMDESISHIAAYYYLYHIIQHYDKWPELMKRMGSLDQHIGKEIPIDDRRVKTRQIFAILTACILGPASLAAHVLYYYFTAPEQIYASDLLLYYSIAQTLVNSFVFDVIVYMICQRFRTINETIKQLDETLGAQWVALRIRGIRKLYNGK